MARPRKVPLEGQAVVKEVAIVAADRKAETKLDAIKLGEIAEAFKKSHPEKWEAIRLCPTQHGIEEMIACLNC